MRCVIHDSYNNLQVVCYTNTPLAEKKAGWIDFNTGVIADGEKTIDEAAKDLLDLVIRVASGEQTKAEKHGFREISIFKDGVVL